MKQIYKFSLGAIVLGSTIFAGYNLAVNEDKITTSSKSTIKTTNQTDILKSEIQLDVPLLNQMDHPRLYNGCEVTSLAMILNYKGIQVTKNKLANEIVRVPLKYNNGQYGNPNFGFVGNMEVGPGLGAYHDPIYQLAKKYAGDKAQDLTSQPFDQILEKVAEGNPIWVIITSNFTPVEEMQTWETPQGSIDITYSMHSVVITGYDAESIYINNPYGMENQKVDRESFIKTWEQMGKQAIVIH